MNYYIQQDEKIVLFDENLENLLNTLEFMPQYEGLEILETEREIINLDNEFVFKDDVETELMQKEAERIANLYLTGADVERGIYQAIGKDFEDIIEMVETLIFAEAPQVAEIDLKALKIELKANHFYRGNPYVDAVGALLGFTSEQLDKFFETNDYNYLITTEQVEDTSEQVREQVGVQDESTENTES